jgi:hypothetical protein
LVCIYYTALPGSLQYFFFVFPVRLQKPDYGENGKKQPENQWRGDHDFHIGDMPAGHLFFVEMVVPRTFVVGNLGG